MTRQRIALYLLLLTVAAAAAVLSFSALRDLALMCGFDPGLAWLLPVVVDAGAAAGSLVWLGQWSQAGADRYARTLALLLLGGSVAGNALGHGLEAYQARPHWLVVVGVSAIAPTVLGALVHLVVLVGRRAVSDGAEHDEEGSADGPVGDVATPGGDRAAELIAAGVGRRRLARELAIPEHQARALIEGCRNGHPAVTR